MTVMGRVAKLLKGRHHFSGDSKAEGEEGIGRMAQWRHVMRDDKNSRLTFYDTPW